MKDRFLHILERTPVWLQLVIVGALASLKGLWL